MPEPFTNHFDRLRSAAEFEQQGGKQDPRAAADDPDRRATDPARPRLRRFSRGGAARRLERFSATAPAREGREGQRGGASAAGWQASAYPRRGVEGAKADPARPARGRRRPGLSSIAVGLGWLVTVGLGALLATLSGAVSAALGGSRVAVGDGSIDLARALLLLPPVLLAYAAGGYAAGRIAGGAGARHGVGVWLVALLVSFALAALGSLVGTDLNILSTLRPPRVPIDAGGIGPGTLLVLLALVFGSLAASVLGGRAGAR